MPSAPLVVGAARLTSGTGPIDQVDGGTVMANACGAAVERNNKRSILVTSLSGALAVERLAK